MKMLLPIALLAGVAMPIAVAAQPAGPGAPAPAAGGSAGAAGMTLAQFQAQHEGRTMAADTDGDGRVSRPEFMAAADGGRGDPAGRFARLDRNGDGYVDKAEVDAMLAHRFARLDADGNGVVTPQERAVARAARAGTSGDGPGS